MILGTPFGIAGAGVHQDFSTVAAQKQKGDEWTSHFDAGIHHISKAGLIMYWNFPQIYGKNLVGCKHMVLLLSRDIRCAPAPSYHDLEG